MIRSPSSAPYACRSEETRGRLFPEPESATRSCFQRDRDRIIHSAAFRRLQYKTQVFVNHEGDFFRTRLTHSLEVSQIARSVCRYLSLNEDLAEALALAHDLGHPPFGHAGEDALDDAMQPFGGFDHNAQSLKTVTSLEERYAEFDGLNLTWETLEGVVKHNGPLIGPYVKAWKKDKPIAEVILDYDSRHPLGLETFASAEAQIAALADDVAYNNHDIDDGLRAGLFRVRDLADVPLAGPVFAQVQSEFPDIEQSRLIHEAVRRMIGMMVIDLLEETQARISAVNPKHPDDIRNHTDSVVAFSEKMRENDRALKKFLFENMYRHYKLNRMTSKARRVVGDLFRLLVDEPNCLPTEWRNKAGEPGSEQTSRLVTDYIAGITDRYALDEHEKLFNLQARAS